MGMLPMNIADIVSAIALALIIIMVIVILWNLLKIWKKAEEWESRVEALEEEARHWKGRVKLLEGLVNDLQSKRGLVSKSPSMLDLTTSTP